MEKITGIRNTQDFWGAVRYFRGRSQLRNSIRIEEWTDFLRTKYEANICSYPTVLEAHNPLLNGEITMDELNRILKLVRKGKAPGSDGVTYEFFNTLPLGWKQYLLHLFNLVIDKQKVPSQWAIIKIFFYLKKGIG